MDISGVNDKFIKNTIDSAKAKVGDDNFEKRLQQAISGKDEKELKKVCIDFESVFLSMMYKQMKASVPKSDLLPEEPGREIFESMMDDRLMEQASKGNGMGLGDMLYKQLSKQMKSIYKID